MKRLFSSVAITALLVASTPSVALAQPSDAAATLQVDTSELGSVGPVLRDRMLERGAQVFRDNSVLSGEPDDPVVAVAVREVKGEDPGFIVKITLTRSGTGTPKNWEVTCDLCTESELIDKVAEQLVTVSAVIVSNAEAKANAEEAPPEQVTEPPPPTTGPNDDDSKLHVLTKAGIGTTVAGVLVLGAGVGLAVAAPQPLDDDPTRERYTQPPGYALLAIGGVAVVTGVVLMAVGSKRKKQSRVAASPTGVRVRF